ncbi:SDR family oxidoreductase [Exiguobacterium sp. SH5S13]|uniref:SDR family NAD(P)-dependent oxidoreductase n=1 Tax=Exiguobacterium sp. SH5S13 TaxID=2510959 RepID=UPI00103DFB50|nr:SDR family oxidoreductase [Exiguobacterium sp. SH5S13]TCI49512.1 SDR family oxidoreductase [Exiguobacterium sp. SH5S13]
MKKAVLITGVSGGIGKELADRFARDGHEMVLVSRNEAKLLELAKDYRINHGVGVTVIAKDIASPGVPEAIYKELQEKGIHVDYLVNNAGFGLYGTFLETDMNQEVNMIDVNIKALTVMTKLFLPGMVERNQGGIMNVSSMVGFFPGPLMSVYHATKSYVLSFSEALENEVSGTNVTVTALCPGLTSTGFVDRSGMQASKLFQTGTIMEAGRVADIGYRGFMNGKTLIIPGRRNRLVAFLPRLLSRKRITRMMRTMQDGSKQ